MKLKKVISLLFTIVFAVGGLVACTSQPANDNKEQAQEETNKQSNEEDNEKQISKVKFYEFDTNMQLTLKDIQTPFSKPELNLQPQAGIDYPKLNGIEAKAYQLIDGTVFIHVFKNNENLKKGLNQIQDVYEPTEWELKVYEVNNMLFVYQAAYATKELVDTNDEKMKEAIKDMIKTNDDELTEQIRNLKEEKKAFFVADQYGRELYHAMVHGDIAKLDQLTTSDLHVFDGHFEVKVNEKTIEVPFSSLQTEPYLNNHVILKTNGYGFDQDNQQVMKIHYMIIHPEKPSSYLNVHLIKVDHLRWKVREVYFDI